MLLLREIQLRSIRYFKLGEPFSKEEQDRRRENLVQDFLGLCPSLKHLQASKLVCRNRPKEDGLHLEFYVCENPQRQLLELNTASSRRNSSSDFAFRSDLQLLQADIERLPLNVMASMSPDRSLLDLMDSTDYGSQIRVIRKAARKKSNLYQHIQPELSGLNIEAPQVVLPFGNRVFIHAQVHDLKTSTVRLKNFEFVDDVPDSILSTEFGSYLEVSRPTIDQDEATNLLLLQALDRLSVLKFEAILAFKWCDGSPHFFELCSATLKHPQ